MKSSNDKKFTLNDKNLGANPGAIAVLHTHSRALDFHPHIHIIMPGASIDAVKRLWSRKESKFLFDHKELAIVFRAKFLEALTDKGLSLPVRYPEKWVVDCLHVGKGDKACGLFGALSLSTENKKTRKQENKGSALDSIQFRFYHCYLASQILILLQLI